MQFWFCQRRDYLVLLILMRTSKLILVVVGQRVLSLSRVKIQILSIRMLMNLFFVPPLVKGSLELI